MIARRGLPVADAPALAPGARRTALVRAAVVGALALVVGAGVTVAGRQRTPGAVAAPAASGATTEVVLDVSGSVGDATYAFTHRAFERLSRLRGPVGLVVFSDSAEEALPPGTPAAELRPLVRLYSPISRARTPYRAFGSRFPLTPWYASFSGGTRISAGIAAAREAMQRDHVRGRVLLISDLGDAADDVAALRRELVRLAQAGIELKVMPLPNTYARDIRRFRRLEGPQVADVALPPRVVPRAPQDATVSLVLVGLGALLALVLAANELYGVSLRWREAA